MISLAIAVCIVTLFVAGFIAACIKNDEFREVAGMVAILLGGGGAVLALIWAIATIGEHVL